MSTVKIPPIFQPLLNNKIFKGLPQQTFLYYTEDVLDQVLEHQNSAACLAGIRHEASGAVRLLRTLRCAAVAARGALDGRGGGDGTVLAGRALQAKRDVGRSRVWLIEAGTAVDRVDGAAGAPVSAGARRTVGLVRAACCAPGAAGSARHRGRGSQAAKLPCKARQAGRGRRGPCLEWTGCRFRPSSLWAKPTG